MKHFFLTGATGFLGRHVIEEMRRQLRAYKIFVLLRDVGQIDHYPWLKDQSDIIPIQGSLLQSAGWEKALSGVTLDGVIHLAALVRHSRSNADEVYQHNIEGTMNVLRIAAAKKCRMLYVSTSGTVGVFKTLQEAADETAPYCLSAVRRWPYYHSKILAEVQAREYAQNAGVDLLIFRPPVLLGPGDHRGRSTGHIKKFIQGKIPFILKGGMHFIDIRDAAAALVRALSCAQAKPVYHLPGFNCELQDFFAMIAELAPCKMPKFKIAPRYLKPLSYLLKKSHLLPDPVVFEMAAHYWGLHSLYAEADLNYKSRDPRETLQDTLDWLKEDSC